METVDIVPIDQYIALLRAHGWPSDEIDAELLAIVKLVGSCGEGCC